MIHRILSERLRESADRYPVLTITGPRQSGKTTCCRDTFPDLPYRNLESPDTREYAIRDPRGFLEEVPDGAVIDEIQRTPDLPSYLQGIVDAPGFRHFYVLTGSQNFSVKNTINQSLAGRTALFQLLPFSYVEIREELHYLSVETVIYNGFYPRVYDRDIPPHEFYADYVHTYLERDLRSLSLVKDLSVFQIFLKLCAGRSGQVLNIQSLANDTGISQATAKEWLSLLEASYIVFRVKPFFQNIGKRLVKRPKLYFYDSGLASYLMDITDPVQIRTHPLRGALYETLVVSELVKHRFNNRFENNLLFYRDSNGNEVDIIIPVGDRYTAVEIKSSHTITGSQLKGLFRFEEAISQPVSKVLVHPGDNTRCQSDVEIIRMEDIERFL
jgi:uncharacterized protein